MTVYQLVQIIWAVSCGLLIILVLLHSPKGDGLGALVDKLNFFLVSKVQKQLLIELHGF